MNDLLLQLRDKGNTVLVVEHKPEVIAIADHVVDLGPGAGGDGGQVVFEGTIEALRKSDTVTGRHLDDRAALKESVRSSSGALEVRGASTHNLQKVDVDIPLGVLCRDHRRRRLRQELADQRLGGRPRRRRGDRPGADPRLATQQSRRPTPDCSTRSARRSRRPTA